MVELLLGHALDGGVIGDAGVVDQDVHRSEVGEHFLDEVLRLLVVGHVGGVAFGFHAQGLQLCLYGDHLVVACAAAESHVAALLGEPYSNGVTDATGGTGHDCGLIF